MDKFILNVIIVIAGVFIVSSSYAAVKIDEDFESGSISFMDGTNGTFQPVISGGNKFGEFELSSVGGNELLFSSLIFQNLIIDSDSTLFSFDYKFDYEFNSPQTGPHAGATINDVLLDGADFLRVSVLGDFDYEIFKSAFDPNDVTSQVISSPASDDFGFNLPIDTAPSAFLPNFTHIDMDLSDFIAKQGLVGKTVQVFVEIINGNEYFDFVNNANLLTLDEFNTMGAVDNIFFGPQTSSVPEPSGMALTIFGIGYLFRRIKKRFS